MPDPDRLASYPSAGTPAAGAGAEPAQGLPIVKGPDPAADQGTGWLWLALGLLPGLLLAVWLYWPSRAAGFISDDTAAIGYVFRQGSWSDWTQAQYGLESIRFWRPLVTSSLGWVAAVFGPEAGPQRAFNLLAALAAMLAGGGLTARLMPRSAGRAAQMAAVAAAGLLLASFMHQGGTTTWVVGRVDSLCLPFVLAAGWAGAAGRGWLAAVACGLAIATKEMGLMAPICVLGAAWGAGRPPGEVVRTALPGWIVLAVLVVLRARFIGDWVGGYATPAALDFGRLPVAAEGVGSALGSGSLLLPAALILAWWAGGRPWRSAAGLLLPATASFALLGPLLLSGGLLAEHRRWLLVPDALLCIAAAVALGRAWAARSPGGARRVAAALLAVVLLGAAVAQRSGTARQSVTAWTAGANLATEFTGRVRAATAALEPSQSPVFVVDVPRTTPGGEAYALHWGFADRFRGPFEATPRPVWPWRTVFGHPDSERGPIVLPIGGLRYPTIDPLPRRAQRSVPVLELDADASGELRFTLGPEILQSGAGPVLKLSGTFPCPRLELVLFTALGYEPATWGGPWPPVDGHLDLPLRDLLLSPGRVPLSETLALAADVGERIAYLELRAVDDERGQTNRPIAASNWIRLELTPELADALRQRVFTR